ncbi:hypothetical protein DL768_011103 [Monosporascus sp. mg162]|nr:hypothetical protein DL768_011103 [Monosporascus sp. mg162]
MHGIRALSMTDHDPGTEPRYRGYGDSRDARHGDGSDLTDGRMLAVPYPRRQSTDNGNVPNLKWSFQDSKTRMLRGGWVLESLVTDLPSSHDLAGAQQHLPKGTIREFPQHYVVGINIAGLCLALPILTNGAFGLLEEVFASVPSRNPYTTNGTADGDTRRNVAGGNGPLTGNASFAYHARDQPPKDMPHDGGALRVIGGATFPRPIG